MSDNQLTTTASDIEAIGESLTQQQRELLDIYSRTGNGARSASRAGYIGDYNSLAATASRIVNSVKGRQYLDALYKQRHMTDDALLALVERQAQGSLSHFVNDDGIPDLSTEQAKDNIGLLRQVEVEVTHYSKPDNTDVETVRTKLSLHDPQKASELLLRARGMLRDKVDVDVTLDADQAIDKIAGLLASAASRARGVVIEGESKDITPDTNSVESSDNANIE